MSTLIPKVDLMNGGSIPTGAVNRPINEKIQEVVSVGDFGADATGVASSTTAVQNALTDSLNVSFPNGTFKVGDVNVSDTGTVLSGSGQIENTISDDTSGNTLYVEPFRASMENLRLMVDKTSTRCLTNLLEFKNIGINAVMADFLSGPAAKEYLDNAYALGMGVVLEYDTDTPDVTYDNHPALIGYYLYDEPANRPSPISIVTQNVRINAWKAVTNKPLMSTFYGQYDLTPAMSPLWDVIFVDYYYRDSLTDSENISVALRAFANLQFTCPQTAVIPMVGLFTDSAGTSVSKRINFSRDIVRFSTDGSYAVFAWLPQSVGFPESPQNDSDFYNFCAELPVLVKSKSQIQFEIVGIGPMLGAANYYIPSISDFGNFKLNDQVDGAISFKEGGGLFALGLSAMGMTDCQFLFRNSVPFDVTTTTIRIYQSNNGFNTKTIIITYPNVADATYLSSVIYNSGNCLLGLDFTPAASDPSYGKYITGFMIYNNWTTLSF
jgi:hypothetical protein